MNPTETDESTQEAEHSLTLAQLAKKKRLPVDWLRDTLGLGNHASNQYGDGAHVTIPYYHADGSPARTRCRNAEKQWWSKRDWPYIRRNPSRRELEVIDCDSAQEIIPYGVWRAQDQYGWCVIVEGESDCWAAWKHGVPCVGLPGAESVRPLRLEHVATFSKLYVFSEPDEAGQKFPHNVAARLVEIRWQGELAIISSAHVLAANGHSQCKDLSDVHVASAKQFMPRLYQAIAAAKPLPLPPPPSRTAVKHRVESAGGTHYQYSAADADKDAFLDDIDLEAVINSEIGHRAGRSQKWNCPFHPPGGKKPDLGIFQWNGRQYWKCHSGQCGKSGDAAHFVMRLRGLTFPEALKYLGFQPPKTTDTQPTGVHHSPENPAIEGFNGKISLLRETYRDNLPLNPPKVHEDGESPSPELRVQEKIVAAKMLDEFHTAPKFKKKFSPCRRMKRAMRDIDHHEQQAIFGFPCWQGIGCDVCGPLWIDNRVGWFADVVAQWDACYAVCTPDEEVADSVVRSIARKRKAGQPAFYIRIPVVAGTMILTNTPHKLARKLDNGQFDPLVVLRDSVQEAARLCETRIEDGKSKKVKRRISATHSIRYKDEKAESSSRFEHCPELESHPRFDTNKSVEDLAAHIAGDPSYELRGVSARDHYTCAVLAYVPTMLAIGEPDSSPADRNAGGSRIQHQTLIPGIG